MCTLYVYAATATWSVHTINCGLARHSCCCTAAGVQDTYHRACAPCAQPKTPDQWVAADRAHRLHCSLACVVRPLAAARWSPCPARASHFGVRLGFGRLGRPGEAITGQAGLINS